MELTGNRVSTDANQLITTGAFSARKGFQIAWHITEASPGAAFHYEYTISGVDGGALGKTLSRWILEVSNPSSRSDFSNFNGIQEPYDGQYVPATWNPKQGCQGQPGDIYGIRFNSVRTLLKPVPGFILSPSIPSLSPVWGDFYAQGIMVFTPITPALALIRTFLPRISPPGSWCLAPGRWRPCPAASCSWAPGLVGLGLLRLRRRQKKA